jgi:hypothetical protein
MPLNFPRHTKDSHFLTTTVILIYNILILPDLISQLLGQWVEREGEREEKKKMGGGRQKR